MTVLEWRRQIQIDLEKKLTLDHQALSRYCHFYGLSRLGCKIELVKLESRDRKKEWVCWHFLNLDKKNQDYAIVSHGLFDHSAYMSPLINSLLSQGLNVIALELPGHGLDFRGVLECENFDEYTELNKSATAWLKQQGASVLVEVAHSTGAVGRLNRLLNGEECEHKVVFLNPLVKIQMFQLAKISYKTFSSVLPSIPRKKWGRGEDPEFLSFRSRDPLQPWKIPKKWIQHYWDWIEEVARSDVKHSGDQLLVLLGGSDHVVNAEESIKELSSHFNKFKSFDYPNLGHQMLYGDENEVQDVLLEINRWWSGVGPSNS